jgi:tRNA A58 N-methylase Trm61
MIENGEQALLRAEGREYFAVAGDEKPMHTDLGIVDLKLLPGKEWGDTIQ